jgi:thioesterase domain-containing protein
MRCPVGGKALLAREDRDMKMHSNSFPSESGRLADKYLHMDMLANAAFGREVLRKVKNVILPLNDQGTGPSIYCIHSVTGAATDFRFLAQMLGPQQKFYGIQAPTIKRNAEFASSIESVSQYYVDALIGFQPEGAFVLAGHSVGSIIALEIAQQLRARGREVCLLVVLDGEIFNTGTEIGALNPLYWGKLFCNLPRWVRDEMAVDFSWRAFGRSIAIKSVAIRKRIVARMRGDSLSSGHAVEGFIDAAGCSADHMEFMKALYEIQFLYVPKEYPGPVTVYVAQTQPLTHLRQVKAPWRKVAPASNIVSVKGNHTTMIRPPHGIAVAEHLATQLASL